MKFCIMKLLIIFILTLPLTAAPDFYVNQAATGNNDGSSWENAFTTLTDALSQAISSQGGTEIWVASGTYYPDEGQSSSNNDEFSEFPLQSNTTLLGGFIGNETSANERNPIIHPTILSGDLEQNDLDPNSNDLPENLTHIQGTNSRTLISIGSGAENIHLDGFFLTSARTNLALFRASATVTNCHILGGFKAGISLTNSSTLNISNSTITHCASRGIFVATESVFNADCVTMSDTENPIISSSSDATVNLTRTCFKRINIAPNGLPSAIALFSNASLNIRSSLFLETPDQSSPAPVIRMDTDKPCLISNTTFYGHDRTAIANTHSTPGTLTITNTIIWDTNDFSPQVSHPSPTISHTLIENENLPGLNNLDGTLSTPNQIFTDPTNNDFRLHPDSPALDAGSNTFVTEHLDLAKKLRISGTVDLGAFEGSFTASSLPSLTIQNLGSSILLTLSPPPTSNLILEESINLHAWASRLAITPNQSIYSIPIENSSPRFFRLSTP